MNLIALARKVVLCVIALFASIGAMSAWAENVVPANSPDAKAEPQPAQEREEDRRPLPPNDINPITAGATEITAKNAPPDFVYQAWDWPKAAGANGPVLLGSTTAALDGTLDFKSLTQKPAAGDTILVRPASPRPPSRREFLDAGVAVTAPAAAAASDIDKYPTVIVGYQQSGANSASSSGRLYVDISYGHALSDNAKSFLKNTRMFGNVRVGSSSQTASSTVGGFVAGLAGTESSLQLNQVASVAEFFVGMDYSPSFLQSTDGKNRFAAFAEFGGLGSLQSSNLDSTYAFPANPSQAYTLLVAAEAAQQKQLGLTNVPTIPTTCTTSTEIPGVANNCMFVEFEQQQPYFNQEAYIGIKYAYHAGEAENPGLLSIGAGANNAVNRKMDFNALHLDGYAPFQVPAGKSGAKPTIPVIYFFGSASLAFNHSKFPNVNNFIPLNPVSSVVYENLVQAPSASNTYVIPTMPQRQEYYSIGVGVSLTDIWSTLFSSKSSN